MALFFEEGVDVENTDVAFVENSNTSLTGLPEHQAIMVLEHTKYAIAINTGRDGDLMKNWQAVERHIPTGANPTIRYYDGYYYGFGGDTVSTGPYRTKDL